MLIPAGRRHVTKRTTGASHDRHLCAHGVNRPRSAAVTCSPSVTRCCASSIPPHLVGAANLAARCHVVVLDQAIDGPWRYEAGKKSLPERGDYQGRETAGRDGPAPAGA